MTTMPPRMIQSSRLSTGRTRGAGRASAGATPAPASAMELIPRIDAEAASGQSHRQPLPLGQVELAREVDRAVRPEPGGGEPLAAELDAEERAQEGHGVHARVEGVGRAGG